MIPPLFGCHSGRWVGTRVDSRFPGSHFYMGTAKNNCTWKRLWKESLYPTESKQDGSPTNLLLPGHQKVPLLFPPMALKGNCDGESCMEHITVLNYLQQIIKFVNFQEHIAGHCQLGKGSVPVRAPKANGSLASWKVCH